MNDEARADVPVGYTIDLSSPRTGKRPRTHRSPQGKSPPPVVTQTINLSTPKPSKAEATPAPSTGSVKATPAGRATPKAGRPKGPGTRAARTAQHSAPRDAPRDARGGGTSLADLLDEATLARLRGA